MPDIIAVSVALATSVWGGVNLTASSAATATGTLGVTTGALISGSSVATGTGTLTVALPVLISGDSTAAATGTLALIGGVDSLTVRDVIQDVLRVWGCSCDGPGLTDCIQQEAVAVVNASMQFIHANGSHLPYLTRRTRVYYLPTEQEGIFEMESDVQAVDGAVWVAIPEYSRAVTFTGSALVAFGPLFPFKADGKVVLLFTFTASADTAEIVLVYGVDYTDAETLRKAIQALIANGATCFVEYQTAQSVRIAFDKTPKMVAPFPTVGQLQWPLDTWQLRNAGGAINSVADSYDASANQPRRCSPVASRTQFDNFAHLYGGESAFSAVPVVYFLRKEHAVAADSCRTVMQITTSAIEQPRIVSVDVAIEPARISWADYENSRTIPIPHRYVESLLMPIARFRATSSNRYRIRERHEGLKAQYQEALMLLGMVDPAGSPPETSKAGGQPS